MASLWQQWGRAGRGKGESLGIFIAGNDALEQFFVSHPDQLLNREVEAATVDFANPFIHLRPSGGRGLRGRARRPTTSGSSVLGCPPLSERAEEEGLLRRKSDAWFFTGPGFPAGKIGLRSTAGEQYTIVEGETGDIIGTEGAETAFSALHPGAVYLHMGDTYLVTELDLDRRVALVRPFWDTYHTLPRRETDTRIISESLQTAHGPLTLHLGQIAVTSRVVAFQKRKTGGSEVLGTEELDLPTQEFVTEAMWFTIPPELFPTEADLVRLPGAIHAVEHALIALLPLFAMCDRWDIGGLSTPVHSQTEEPTIFVYDGHAGRGGHLPAGLRALRRVGGRRLPPGARLRLRRGLPLVRPVAQVRQLERAAGQGAGPPAARRDALRRSGRTRPAAGDPLQGRTARCYPNGMQPQYISVIGGGQCGAAEYAAAVEVGRLVAEAGAKLVCGGLSGIMEAAARGAKEAGGTTIGILPGHDRALANPYIDHVVTTGVGHARNLAVVSSGDAVIAIGGSFGTLSEIGLAGRVGRPVVILSGWRVQNDQGTEGVWYASTPREAMALVRQALAGQRDGALMGEPHERETRRTDPANCSPSGGGAG